MSLSVQEKLEAGPMFDMAIVEHHFTDYMRDYDIFVDVIGPVPGGYKSEVIGRSRYRFTHCVLAEVTTSMPSEVWAQAWTDAFTDYQTWVDSGEADGYVWAVNWMGAYPGLSYIADSLTAREWATQLNKPMHEVYIETNAHNIRLVFHDVEIAWTSDGSYTEQGE